MKTTLLKLLSRSAHNKHTRVFTIDRCAIALKIQKRGAGGHSFSVSWFPCWKLTCMWSVYVFSVDPTKRGGEKLRDLLAETLKRENSYYLPTGGAWLLRSI